MKRKKSFKRKIEELDNIVAIQCSNGNWNCDEYMRGMANGLILAQWIMKENEGEPPFFEQINKIRPS